MRPIKKFEEYIKGGIVQKRTPDILRAKSLIQEADERNIFLKEVLNKIKIRDANANYFIEDSYDILMELIRAKFISEGFHSSGEGAHEAEVAYMQELGFSEKETRFMNDLRYFRNGILYYGKKFDAEYGNKVLRFLKETYPKLKKILENIS